MNVRRVNIAIGCRILLHIVGQTINNPTLVPTQPKIEHSRFIPSLVGDNNTGIGKVTCFQPFNTHRGGVRERGGRDVC